MIDVLPIVVTKFHLDDIFFNSQGRHAEERNHE